MLVKITKQWVISFTFVVCLRRSRLLLSLQNYSLRISLFNKYPVLYKLPAEGGRRAAEVYLGIQGNLVKSGPLWGCSCEESEGSEQLLVVAMEAGCPLVFCDGAGTLLEACLGDLVWFGDSSVLNASHFLFIPVPRGSVWPVARSTVPKYPAQGSRQRYRLSENTFPLSLPAAAVSESGPSHPLQHHC